MRICSHLLRKSLKKNSVFDDDKQSKEGIKSFKVLLTYPSNSVIHICDICHIVSSTIVCYIMELFQPLIWYLDSVIQGFEFSPASVR